MTKEIWRLLAMGLSVEDIAVLLNINADRVRDEIEMLRMDGDLVALIRGK